MTVSELVAFLEKLYQEAIANGDYASAAALAERAIELLTK